jgi:uncharacterized protein (DUF305 family)
MNTQKSIIVALALVSGIAVAGYASAQSMQHRGHGMAESMHGQMQANMHGGMQGGMHGGQGGQHGQHGRAAPAGDNSASSLAFAAVNEKMHRNMAIEFSGDSDVDFVRGMIPHHQGAIDMAKIVIAFGKDPEIRKLAEEIVTAQEGEIALMQDWLKKRGQ